MKNDILSINRSDIKQKAKRLMDGRFLVLLLCFIFYYALATALAMFAFRVPNPLETFISGELSLLLEPTIQIVIFNLDIDIITFPLFFIFFRIIVFFGLLYPFTVCFYTIPIAIVNKDRISVTSIFSPISKPRYFIEYMITGISKFIFTILWSLLLLIPGIVAHYRFAFVKYISHENPEQRSQFQKSLQGINPLENRRKTVSTTTESRII